MFRVGIFGSRSALVSLNRSGATYVLMRVACGTMHFPSQIQRIAKQI